jgi:hypothetical protein
MGVVARFRMLCRECQKPIDVGEGIVKRELPWSDVGGSAWVHEDCSHVPRDTERKRAYEAMSRRMRRQSRKSP